MAERMKSLKEIENNTEILDTVYQAKEGLITASELITKLETILDCKFETEVL